MLNISHIRILPQAIRALVKVGAIAPISPKNLIHIMNAVHSCGKNISTLSAIAAIRYGDKPAIFDDLGSISYQQLHESSMNVAKGLKDNYQVSSGKSIGIMCRNHRGFFKALFAGARLGADIVLLNTDFPGPQLAQVLSRHQFAVIVHDEEFTNFINDAGYSGPTVLAWYDNVTNEDTLGKLSNEPLSSLEKCTTNGKLILLTSGTSGTPKGAPRTPNSATFIGPLTTIFESIPFKAGQIMYVAPPLFHGFGLATSVLGFVIGAPIVITRKFKPADALKIIQEHQVNIAFMVPIMLQRILDLNPNPNESAAFSSLKAVLVGAAPLSNHVAEKWIQLFGNQIYNGYGSSETGLATLATPNDILAAPSTVGRPFKGISVKIMDKYGHEQPSDVIGHICIQSDMIFEGYIGGGNKELFNGYMNTGDLGHIDSAGRLFIDGREDDMIISGGENVFPQEVTEVLMCHKSVHDAAVYGVTDEEFGQRLKAFVVCDKTVTEEELKQYLKLQVARFKIPREIVFMDELPRNPSGKVLRHFLPI